MKTNAQLFGVAALATALATGCASESASNSPEVAPAYHADTAIVRSQHGELSYANTNGVVHRVRTDLELEPGTVISSSTASEAYIRVNGLTSTIKVGENSVVELTEMKQTGPVSGGDSETVLTLKQGSLLGSVRKLSANSSYEIYTPNGVAAIRGTDFAITVELLAGAKSRVTYRSVTGQLLVSANVNGIRESESLQTGQEWVPGDGPPKSVNNTIIDPVPWGGTPIILAAPPPPIDYVGPFNGAGAPNPAVDAGQNPYARSRAIPPPVPVAVRH